MLYLNLPGAQPQVANKHPLTGRYHTPRGPRTLYFKASTFRSQARPAEMPEAKKVTILDYPGTVRSVVRTEPPPGHTRRPVHMPVLAPAPPNPMPYSCSRPRADERIRRCLRAGQRLYPSSSGLTLKPFDNVMRKTLCRCTRGRPEFADSSPYADKAMQDAAKSPKIGRQ